MTDMIFFKKKKTDEKPTPSNKKSHSLQEIGIPRVLTAEGWKRRVLKKKRTKSSSGS